MDLVLTTSEVEDRAKVALANSPIYDLRSLSVELAGEALLISGRVDSFYHKQLAQEAVRIVTDGFPVVNSIKVE